MLQEPGITVIDKAKIHMTNLMAEDDAIIFPETEFRITMMLWRISYFPTMKLTVDALQAGNDVFILTPTTWNAHTDVHATNEDSMLDWEVSCPITVWDRLRGHSPVWLNAHQVIHMVPQK